MRLINLPLKEALLKLSLIRQSMLVCFALLSLLAFRNQMRSLSNTLTIIGRTEQDLVMYKRVSVSKVKPEAISSTLFGKDEVMSYVSQLCAEKQIAIVQVANTMSEHCSWAELKIAISGDFVDVLTLLNGLDLHRQVPVCTYIKVEDGKDKLKAHEVECTLFFKIDD
jgi:hypothetical protein